MLTISVRTRRAGTGNAIRHKPVRVVIHRRYDRRGIQSTLTRWAGGRTGPDEDPHEDAQERNGLRAGAQHASVRVQAFALEPSSRTQLTRAGMSGLFRHSFLYELLNSDGAQS